MARKGEPKTSIKKKAAKTSGKSSSKALKKKLHLDKSVSVKGEERPNKHRSYIKLRKAEKSDGYQVDSSDGEDIFYMGTHDLDLTNSTVNQICNICSKGKQFSESSMMQTNAALATILEIDPQDSIELMLATQMTTVHNMAMEMSRRAMHSEQTLEGVELNINFAKKLMRTFSTQVETLNKYRTKGQQKITVQHVNVNEGGQAIVGDINQGGGNE